MKKALSLLLACAMLFALLTACGGPSGGGSTPTPAPATTTPDGDTPDTPDAPDAPLEGEITFWHSFSQGPGWRPSRPRPTPLWPPTPA